MRDVLIHHQNGFGFAGFVAPQLPTALNDYGRLRFGNLTQLARPLSGFSKNPFFFFDALQFSRKKQIIDVLAGHLVGPPTVEALGTLVPEANTVFQVTHNQGKLHLIE